MGMPIQKKFKNTVTHRFADLGPKCRTVMKAVRNRTADGRDEARSGSVIPHQELIDDLACRIETAYRLRCPRWWGGCSTARVWDQAALYLWQAHVEDPERVPLDAGLYVAAQDISCRFANPWFDLAQPEAIERYRSRVIQIVRQLRTELKKEIGRAERDPAGRRDPRSLEAWESPSLATGVLHHGNASRSRRSRRTLRGRCHVATSILPAVSGGKLGADPRGILSVGPISPGARARKAQTGVLLPTLN